MIGDYNKAWVALIMAILSIINIGWGVEWFGPHAEIVIGFVVSLLSPFLVWLIPNGSRSR